MEGERGDTGPEIEVPWYPEPNLTLRAPRRDLRDGESLAFALVASLCRSAFVARTNAQRPYRPLLKRAENFSADHVRLHVEHTLAIDGR